ncbi:MarR family transcriptional regulator [Rhodococcus sp. X156]|uniref:MarR family winged helix-turn-helix transcriptional regulator n=1 Tax=Rhodococcus sp. X156 TaxID=2499145 RepID=UPI001F495F06|nr:MarR family transcriptional regulator [Rhodococcus sp. X156]
MTDPVEAIELETMILGRYVLQQARGGAAQGQLDRSAYLLLSRLEAEGPMSIGQLSDAFGLDSSTLNRQTAAMVRSGVAERIPDPDGGLARKFRVTELGRQRLAVVRDANVAGLRQVMEDWSAEDVELLGTMLRRFNRDIADRDGRPWPRS